MGLNKYIDHTILKATAKKEDIKKINGIGDKTFEKMKERIRVN